MVGAGLIVLKAMLIKVKMASPLKQRALLLHVENTGMRFSGGWSD
jgi:hypothetical protein